jgi:hypothetical protein
MSSIKNSLKTVKTRSYLNRDFDSFRADLLRYVRTYFPDRIQDFSESSVGGMFLDMAAYAGDVSAFYLDHQFKELSVDTAVETKNIQNLLTMAGVKIVGASPSIVTVEISIAVPALATGNRYAPNPTLIPKILGGSSVVSKSGVIFEIDDDLDFADKTRSGSFRARSSVLTRDASGNPATYLMTRSVTCSSGRLATESFNIGSTFVPFRKISLLNSNVTEIISVKDTEGNRYYEVDSLAQDSVFDSVSNRRDDSDLVAYALELIPAPYRYTSSMSLGSGATTLQFGSGDASSLDNDIIPDPSEVSLPIFGKKQLSRVAIDPNSILRTSTLGYSPTGTTITVKYRYGGGVDHNVEASSITDFSKLSLRFPATADTAANSRVRASISVTNASEARGGDAAPTIDDLKLLIPSARNAQNRIVSAPDLLARIYTMSSSYGRVYRAGISPSAVDPNITNLYVCSRNINNEIVVSPDTLKRNMRVYLNQFRLISDNIDILDARILNYTLRYQITVEFDQNKRSVLQSVNGRLKTLLSTTNFQVGQPIIIGDITNVIVNTQGVSSISTIRILPISGTKDGRDYSDSTFNVNDLLRKGVVVCPAGSIFEIKYPENDIIGSAQ